MVVSSVELCKMEVKNHSNCSVIKTEKVRGSKSKIVIDDKRCSDCKLKDWKVIEKEAWWIMYSEGGSVGSEYYKDNSWQRPVGYPNYITEARRREILNEFCQKYKVKDKKELDRLMFKNEKIKKLDELLSWLRIAGDPVYSARLRKDIDRECGELERLKLVNSTELKMYRKV